MCGIAGILKFRGEVDQGDLKLMTDLIAHRGPDGEGHWINPGKKVGLGHRRLSIIDLSEEAGQPMHFADNRYTITFNGEIYNYLELKNILIEKGYSFRTKSDTEVLLAMYHLKGANMLQELDGMFAFAIWDDVEKILFCARDRFGEKPFYYHLSDDGFYFASEMKALFAIGVPVEVDPFMISNFLLSDLVVNPENENQTFYKGIQKLPKSSSLKLSTEGIKTLEKYYEVNSKQADINFEGATLRLQKLLSDSVRLRLRSDVPVSSSLSGGLDSAIIEALVRKELKKSKSPFENITFSARFNESNYSENEYLDDAISAGDIKNFSVYPDYKLIVDDLERAFYHQEEPFWSASMLNHYAVMRLASDHAVPVILEGQGADEMFAGYSWHKRVFLQELYKKSKKKYEEEIRHYNKSERIDVVGKFKTFSPKLFRSLHKLRSKKFASLLQRDEWKKLISKQFADIQKLGSCYIKPNNSSLNEVLYNDLNQYYLETLLRIGDRNSMAFAREVRLPFLDHKLVDFVFSLPSEYKIHEGWQKFILRKSFEDIIPGSITWRKVKIGFAAPQDKWMEQEDNMNLINLAVETLIKSGWLNKDVQLPKKFHWKILMLFSLLKFSKTDFGKC